MPHIYSNRYQDPAIPYSGRENAEFLSIFVIFYSMCLAIGIVLLLFKKGSTCSFAF
jgi:hypothetical protein